MYLGFVRVTSPARPRGLGLPCDRRLRLGGRHADGEHDPHVATQRVPRGSLDESQEVPLDPFPREVVRNEEREGLLVELACLGAAEPRCVGGLVERLPEPA